MYLEEGKKYSKILTDIMVGRGINGIDFIALENAIILNIDENDVVKVASIRKGDCFYRITYVEKSHIVQADPFSPKGDYCVRDSNNSRITYVSNYAKELCDKLEHSMCAAAGGPYSIMYSITD